MTEVRPSANGHGETHPEGHAETTADPADDARFQLAAGAARRIVAQCRAHAVKVAAGLTEHLDKASSSTPHAADLADHAHPQAFMQRVQFIESGTNALVSHLHGLHVLMQSETFYPLPAIPIVRSMAEVAASCAWVLDANVDRDTRNARAYATLFSSIETIFSGTREDARGIREGLIAQLASGGGSVVRKVDKRGKETDEVAQVRIRRGHAKVNFQFSQRVAEQIPLIGGLYGSMSGLAHGEQMHVASAWDSPGSKARLIAVVATRSVESWSHAVHKWYGATASRFVNDQDWENLLLSIPPELVAEFQARDLDGKEAGGGA